MIVGITCRYGVTVLMLAAMRTWESGLGPGLDNRSRYLSTSQGFAVSRRANGVRRVASDTRRFALPPATCPEPDGRDGAVDVPGGEESIAAACSALREEQVPAPGSSA